MSSQPVNRIPDVVTNYRAERCWFLPRRADGRCGVNALVEDGLSVFSRVRDGLSIVQPNNGSGGDGRTIVIQQGGGISPTLLIGGAAALAALVLLRR